MSMNVSMLRRAAVVLVSLVAVTGCSGSDEDPAASEDAATTTAAATPETSTTSSSAPPAASGGGAPAKVLVADGSHWGCPGTFCGPDVSRYSQTDYDPADRLVVARGVEVAAECQIEGDSITDPVTGVSTSVWIRTTQDDGKPWMSAHYFGTTDFDTVLSGIPPC